MIDDLPYTRKKDKTNPKYREAIRGYVANIIYTKRPSVVLCMSRETLSTVNNLGNLYYDQGKLDKAEQMYVRALAGYEKALGPDHTSTLSTVNNLGLLYTNQGKLEEAEQMCIRALAGKEKALGPDHTSTLSTVNNLGLLYRDQGKKWSNGGVIEV